MATIITLHGPRDLRYESRRLDPPGRGEVRLRTRLAAISAGTEAAWYLGTDPQLDPGFRPGRIAAATFPRTLGYEKVAEVVEIGPEVDALDVGRRVVAYYAHADEWVLPADRPIAVPDAVTDEQAIAYSLMTVALHGVHRSRMRIGDDVFVAGQGFLGLLTTIAARLAGARRIVVTDPFERRRALALEVGADLALDPTAGRPLDRVRSGLGLDAVDVAFETSASYEALADALALVRRNGVVCVISQLKGAPARHPGLGIEFHLNELELISSDSRGDVRKLAGWYFDVLRRGVIPDLEPLFTHRVPFGRLERGFELLETQPEDVVKVLVTFE